MRFGKTLVIQEVDGVEPILYPLLRGDLVAQGKLILTTMSYVALIKEYYLLIEVHPTPPLIHQKKLNNKVPNVQ